MAYDKEKWEALRRRTAQTLASLINGESDAGKGLVALAIDRIAQEIASTSDAKAAAIKANEIKGLTLDRVKARGLAYVAGSRLSGSQKAALAGQIFDFLVGREDLDRATRARVASYVAQGSVQALSKALELLGAV